MMGDYLQQLDQAGAARVPPPADHLPPPPPPSAGLPARHGEVVGGRYTPVQRPLIDVQGVKEGLTVGPDEVLVIVCHSLHHRELEAVRDRMRDSGLRPEQILIFGGDVTIGKAKADQIRMIVAQEG